MAGILDTVIGYIVVPLILVVFFYIVIKKLGGPIGELWQWIKGLFAGREGTEPLKVPSIQYE